MRLTALASILVGTVIAILSVIAAEVAAQDFRPDVWNSGTDSGGAPFLVYPHQEAQVMVLFGYEKSKDCSDVKLVVSNIFEDFPLDGAIVEGVFGFPASEKEAPMPPVEAEIIRRDGSLFITSLYTPTDKFYRALFNAETISWRDQSFPADYNALIPMLGFNDMFNQMITSCLVTTSEAPSTGDPV